MMSAPPPLSAGSAGTHALVNDLVSQMNEEFAELNTTPNQYCHNNYLVYKNAFSHIINDATVFKSMLNNIQSAYDSEIAKIRDSHKSSKFSKDQQQEIQDAKETLGTLDARKKELQETLDKLEMDNLSLTMSIQSMRDEVAVISAQSLLEEEDVFKNTVIDNMTLEQMTNVNILSRELGKLQNQHQQMIDVQGSEFAMREKFEDARSLLLKKEDKKEELQEQILSLHKETPAMKQLIEILQQYEEGDNSFEEILVAAQRSFENSNFNKSSTFELYDDEDPAKEKEAEMALAYVEHLEELVRDRNYGAAAIHAANSPNGFLRTMATIEDFKGWKNESEGGTSPLLQYCIVLMNTASQYSPPSEDQSFECVQCAVQENRVDCVAQWIANKSATLSLEIANLLLCNCLCRARCDCESGTLAQAVYRNIEDHEMLIYCLARQGALYRAVHYAKKQNLNEVQLLKLLKKLPSIDLAAILILEEGLNIGQILECLHENHHDNIFIGLLRMLTDSNDLKESLLLDTSGPNIKWMEYVDVCMKLGEQEIAEELQGFIISADAIVKATESLISNSDTDNGVS